MTFNFKSFTTYISNKPIIAKGSEFLHRASSIITNTTQKIFTNTISTFTQKYVEPFKKIVMNSSLYKSIKKIFSPSLPPWAYYRNSFPTMIFAKNLSRWNKKFNAFFSPTLQYGWRRAQFSLKPEIATLKTSTNTFGVPPDYLIPKTLAGKEYLPSAEELFRYFIIHKVGIVNLQHTNTLTTPEFWKFTFTDKTDEFCNYVNHLVQQAGSEYTISPATFPLRYAINNQEFNFGFTNQYTDTFFEQFNRGFSTTARQLTYMLGENPEVALDRFINTLKKTGGAMASSLAAVLESFRAIGSALYNQSPGSVQTYLRETAHGNKIAFPKIWAGSSFTNSFSVKTTLYALSEDPEEIKTKLILPLAVLFALSTPRVEENNPYFYIYPFVCQCEIEGVREFEAAVITDFRFTLGGDRSFYDVNKRYLAIDIEFTVTDVYDIMVTPQQTLDVSIVPTTAKWFRYMAKSLGGRS